jgi:flavin reductase (DIM6/NTAB) family NADH-FMN oxidoreductase RutF
VTTTEADLDARAFRDCVGSFATGVTVITAADGETHAGMTLNSFTSVSLDPLLVLVSLAHGTRTLDAIAGARRFTVSVLDRWQSDVALAFAARGVPFPEHLVTVDGEHLPVRGAAATIRCSVADLIPAGDHDLALGAVTGFTTRRAEPLVFYRGRLGGLSVDSIVPQGLSIGGWETLDD